MEKLAVNSERVTKGMCSSKSRVLSIDGLKISNSQVKRLERELKNLKEEVSTTKYGLSYINELKWGVWGSESEIPKPPLIS